MAYRESALSVGQTETISPSLKSGNFAVQGVIAETPVKIAASGIEWPNAKFERSVRKKASGD
jgi:hypothetical protein